LTFIALVLIRIYAITFETIAIAIEKDYFDIKMTAEISAFIKAILFYKVIINCFLEKTAANFEETVNMLDSSS